MKDSKFTDGIWKLKISTPKEESEKWGGNCGANGHIYAEIPGKYIMGVPATKTIAFLPHWRNDEDNNEYKANSLIMSESKNMYDVIKEFCRTDRTEKETSYLIIGANQLLNRINDQL